jgi:hypothetical protein
LTLRELTYQVLGLRLRSDVRARLLGYVVMLRVSGGWKNLALDEETARRLRRQFEKHGIQVDEIDV